MKNKIIGGLVVAMLAVTSVASAQTHTPVITARQHMQESRIHRGERNGQLTRSEARNLQMRENRLERQKMMARADGRVTRAERRHLRREENRLSRSIYNKKHNYRRY